MSNYRIDNYDESWTEEDETYNEDTEAELNLDDDDNEDDWLDSLEDNYIEHEVDEDNDFL